LTNTQGVLEIIRISCLSHPPLNPLPSREGKREERPTLREGKAEERFPSREGKERERLPPREGKKESLQQRNGNVPT